MTQIPRWKEIDNEIKSRLGSMVDDGSGMRSVLPYYCPRCRAPINTDGIKPNERMKICCGWITATPIQDSIVAEVKFETSSRLALCAGMAKRYADIMGCKEGEFQNDNFYQIINEVIDGCVAILENERDGYMLPISVGEGTDELWKQADAVGGCIERIENYD